MRAAKRPRMAEKQIGSRTFRCEKLKVREAVRLQMRLGKTLGPALPALAEVIRIEDEAERDRRALEAIGAFFAAANAEEAESLVFDLCAVARVQIGGTGNYEPVIPDHHLEDPMMAYQVAVFVVTVQFAGFTDAISRLSSGGTMATAPAPRNVISAH